MVSSSNPQQRAREDIIYHALLRFIHGSPFSLE